MQYALLAIYDSEIEMSLEQEENDDLLNSPSTFTVTSPRRSPRKIENSDRTSSTTSMTPLLSRTLLYGQDEKDDEEVAAATHGTTQQSAVAESPQKTAYTFSQTDPPCAAASHELSSPTSFFGEVNALSASNYEQQDKQQ